MIKNELLLDQLRNLVLNNKVIGFAFEMSIRTNTVNTTWRQKGDGFVRIDWGNIPIQVDIDKVNQVIDTHNSSDLTVKEQAIVEADTGYTILPEWACIGTAIQAENYLTEQIFSGQTQAQVEIWIDANITNITTANVSQINARLAMIRQGLKLASGAIITMRGFFIITAKLLIYIRDLVIRFRK